jgi:putative ABC transport system permease protein
VQLGSAFMALLTPWLPASSLQPVAVVRLDALVLLFTGGIIIVTGVLFGIAPALHAARTDLAGSLKEGGRSATSGVLRNRIRGALVVAEVALAFVLLSGAALLIRSFYQLQEVEPGFETTNVITM